MNLKLACDSLLTTVLIPLVLAPGIAPADTEWEYTAEDGYHPEEWWDPTDWFNEDDEISYEIDDLDKGSNPDDEYRMLPLVGGEPEPAREMYVEYGSPNSDDIDRRANRPEESEDSGQVTQQVWEEQGPEPSVKLQGYVAEMNAMGTDGTGGHNLLARIELQRGESAIVDFGDYSSLGTLDLESGDSIQVTGVRRTVDGKSVIVAHEVRVEGYRLRVRD